ncbi:MAG: hypothetical protein WCT27_01815 [Patescibacteria group bacterium]|jgi:hypothetical protein
MSSETLKPNRLLAAGFLLIILIIVGYSLFTFISTGESAKLKNDQEISIGKKISDDTSITWKTFPYFGKNFAFLVSYPIDWEIGTIIVSPDNPYDDQPVVSFNENSILPGKNSLSIKYFFDTGEDLSTWTTKRIDFLIKQKEYRPIQTNITANGVEFIRLCFLGDAKYSPMPDCFAYTRVKPYILELRTDSASSSFPAQQYIDGFISNFSILQPGENWSTFINSTAGISMKYPPEKYPLFSNDPSQYINFTKEYIGQFMNVQIVKDWTHGPIQYWYSELSESENKKQTLPQKIILDNRECYFADFSPSYSYEGIIGAKQFFCQSQDRLYVFTISSNDQPVDIDLYRMMSSVNFLR